MTKLFLRMFALAFLGALAAVALGYAIEMQTGNITVATIAIVVVLVVFFVFVLFKFKRSLRANKLREMER